MREEFGDRPAAIVLNAATEAAAVAKSMQLPLVSKPFELEESCSDSIDGQVTPLM
jgi:hypothetical protein